MAGCGAGLRPGRSLRRSTPRSRTVTTRCCTKVCLSGRRRNARHRPGHRPSTHASHVHIHVHVHVVYACVRACVRACVLACLRACVLACLRACVRACICALARSSLRVARAAPHPPKPTTCTPLSAGPFGRYVLRTDVCYTMRRLWVANVGRRLGLGRHGTQRAATCHFPSPPPSPPQRQWGSRTGPGGSLALERSLGRLRPLQEHRTAGNLRSTPSPSSHPGRLRRLPKELARRTRPRRSPSTPPSPPSPRAEGPSPRSRRLSRRRRRVRSRCRATRRSGPGSSSYCAATATTPLRFKPRGCLCTASMSAEPCWVSRGTVVRGVG